ncbi:MORN repeat-containing protein 4-like [Homarus americanus]|uniref:MORN repeat-containing protein 4-like n=1 Tax=Homarus americanus TaxID=6706 RepID=A0A8J5K8L2_HOMAM|nr:MORN repeat-containing protein 4-like [Homarus americanus]
MANRMRPGVVKYGSHKHDDGTHYVGDWNEKGQKHEATFHRYEGEFMQGWFHGHGIFWRNDNMRFEGEFRGGRIWGHGLVTYADGSNGFPRNEGFFQDCRFMRKTRCPQVIQRAQKVAHIARAQMDQ